MLRGLASATLIELAKRLSHSACHRAIIPPLNIRCGGTAPLHDMKKPADKQPRRARRAPYVRKPHTPHAKQVAVEAMAMTGANFSQIAREVGINRETVVRILTQSEMEMRRAEGRSIILEAVPVLAAKLVEIAKNNDLIAILAALRGVGALTNKLEVENSTAAEQRSYAFPKVAFFHRHGRWPTEKEAIAFDRTLDVEPLVKASQA